MPSAFASDATREQVGDFDPVVVAESLRNDAALLLQRNPQLRTVHAQLLRAATLIEVLARAEDD